MKNKLLMSYAEDFVSFFIKQYDELEIVKTIILFGSVARGDAREKSDVDIFIELWERKKDTEHSTDRIKKDFFESVRFRQYWSLLGVENELNVLVGTFEEWKDLKNSIAANGIVLYGRYTEIPEGRPKIIVTWSQIKNNSVRVTINKKIFGYKSEKKTYSGILQKYDGEKIGKGVLLLPERAEKEVRELFRTYHVKSVVRRIVGYD